MGSPEKIAEPSHVGWRCATCRQLITSIEDGWVEWLAGEDEHGNTLLRGLRLVHGTTANPGPEHGCQYDQRHEFKSSSSVVEGLPLGSFVGPDGLMLLLSLVAAGELPTNEILELAKRVQIPGYEQARELFNDAIAQGVLKPSIGEGYYLQSEIHALLGWAVKTYG
jgi:hypothetical protein